LARASLAGLRVRNFALDGLSVHRGLPARLDAHLTPRRKGGAHQMAGPGIYFGRPQLQLEMAQQQVECCLLVQVLLLGSGSCLQ